MTSSNIKMNPYQYGYQMARSGQSYYSPYENKENTAEFKKGFNECLADKAIQEGIDEELRSIQS